MRQVERARTPRDFTEQELHDIAAILQERYGAPVSVDLADSELLLDPAEAATTDCPTVYWCARGAQFVVFKVSDARFRWKFFYTDADHYGTVHDEYDDFANCVLTLLRVQADHEGDSAGASTAAQNANPGKDEYAGPAML